MLFQVAAEMGIDLSRSYLVGDAATDLVAGRRAGCQSFLVLTGRGVQQLLPALRAVDDFTIARNLMGAAAHIVKAELNMLGEYVGSIALLHSRTGLERVRLYP
jgi:D-glycero-D-manno-heptose 1,7-bisphosphate phosphatase